MNKIQNPFGHPLGMLKKQKETERRIHTRVCSFLRSTYPTVRFLSTLDGEKFDKWQAMEVRALQWGRGAPDLLIFHPSCKYCGLAIELKRDRLAVFKKDGGLKAGEHLAEQADWLEYLQETGWKALFGCGYADIELIITDYINYG